MSTIWRRSASSAIVLLLCCGGAWLSAGLLDLHDRTPAASGLAGRLIAELCHSNSGESGGCAASARSPWSAVTLPLPGHPVEVPVAFLGLSYFITLGIWYASVGWSHPAWKPLEWLPIALLAVGVYSSIFFLSLMAMGRSPWCVGCVSVHLINFIVVGTIALCQRGKVTESVVEAPIPLRQALAVIVICVLVIGGLYISRNRRVYLEGEVADLRPYEHMIDVLQSDPKVMMDAYMDGPVLAVPLRADERVPGAAHQLVIYLDYECPACLVTHGFIHEEIMKDLGERLNVVVRHYPICMECNPYVRRTLHPDACAAAYAAEAARILGGRAAFDRMTDLLFANAPSLSTAIGREMASAAGVDPDQFMKDLHDPAVHKRVAEDVAEAHVLGVSDTPTLFLDGRRVPDICMARGFWEAVAREPATQSGAK